MPVARRHADVLWTGPLASGSGTLTSASGALEQLPVTWASRTEQPDGRTSPEELIASAHASCFAMALALALVLDENQTPPERLEVSAACTLDEVDGAPRITAVDLTVRAQVPGLDASGLERIVERAADLCPVSNALRGNVEVDVRCDLLGSHRGPHTRQDAEVEDIVRALRGYGVLTRARLLDVSGADRWPDRGANRAIARAVSSGRVKRLGDELYEVVDPPSTTR